MGTLGFWRLAREITGARADRQARRTAVVTRVEPGGRAWVKLPEQGAEIPVARRTAEVEPGQAVPVVIRGGYAEIAGNVSNPAAGVQRVLAVEALAQDTAEESARTAQAVVNAQQTADEAQKVAEATNQHFWSDTNGAHVTDVTQDEWTAAVDDNFSDYDPDTKPYHNQLLNSLGILLRTALNNLVSITRSAIAFYDGAGNAASNIVARFGSDGAQIGKSTGQHVAIDQDSLDIMNGEATLATFGETAVIGQRNNAGSMNIYLGKSESYNPGITQIIRWADRTSYYPYFTAIHDRNNGNDYVLIGSGGGTYPGYGQYSVALGSFSWQTAGSFGRYSIAEGKDSCAGGEASHAQNLGTIAAKRSQTAIGTYNEEDTSSATTHPSGDARYGDYALIIGNGTSDSNRSNALTVDWSGNVSIAGDVQDMSGNAKYTGIATSSHSSSGVSIAAGANYYLNLGSSTQKTGYVPVAVVVDVSGMSNYDRLNPSTLQTNGTYIWSRVHNTGSSASTGTITATVYWLRA